MLPETAPFPADQIVAGVVVDLPVQRNNCGLLARLSRRRLLGPSERANHRSDDDGRNACRSFHGTFPVVVLFYLTSGAESEI